MCDSLGYFEDAKESKRAKDGEAEWAALQWGPDHFKYGATDHKEIETIEGGFKIDAKTERIDFQYHFTDEQAKEHEFRVDYTLIMCVKIIIDIFN